MTCASLRNGNCHIECKAVVGDSMFSVQQSEDGSCTSVCEEEKEERKWCSVIKAAQY